MHHVHWFFIIVLRYTENFRSVVNIQIYFLSDRCPLLTEVKCVPLNLLTYIPGLMNTCPQGETW